RSPDLLTASSRSRGTMPAKIPGQVASGCLFNFSLGGGDWQFPRDQSRKQEIAALLKDTIRHVECLNLKKQRSHYVIETLLCFERRQLENDSSCIALRDKWLCCTPLGKYTWI